MTQLAAQRDPKCIEGANGTGATIPAFRAVKGAPAGILLPTAITDGCWGITTADVPDQTRGDVQYAGVAIYQAGTGGVTAGDRLVPEANTGKLITWAPGAGVNASIMGIAHLTTPADGFGEILLGVGAIGQGA